MLWVSCGTAGYSTLGYGLETYKTLSNSPRALSVPQPYPSCCLIPYNGYFFFGGGGGGGGGGEFRDFHG